MGVLIFDIIVPKKIAQAITVAQLLRLSKEKVILDSSFKIAEYSYGNCL